MVASTSIPTAPFRPDPDQAALLFDALASPTLSLQQVATQFNTTVEALSIFITAPRGTEALASLNAALLTRLQVIALSTLPSVVASLAAIVDEHSRFEAAEPEEALSRLAARSSSSAPNPNHKTNPDPLTCFKLLERKRINARKAASLLYRLATLHPRALREPRPDHPSTPPRNSSTTMHTHRAAHTPRPPVASAAPAATASSASAPHDSGAPSPSAAFDARDLLDPLDPLDPVDDFSIPSFLRARVPVESQLIAHAVPASGGMFPAPGGTCGLTTAAAPLSLEFTPPPMPPLGRSTSIGARSLLARAGAAIPSPAPSTSAASDSAPDATHADSSRAKPPSAERGPHFRQPSPHPRTLNWSSSPPRVLASGP